MRGQRCPKCNRREGKEVMASNQATAWICDECGHFWAAPKEET